MTAPIYFNVEEARSHLIKEGCVYTVRKRRGTGTAIARHGSFFKFGQLGTVRITQMLLLHDDGKEAQLCEYVPYSGFRTVQEWLSNVKGWKHPMFLYKVELMERPEVLK